MLMHAQDKTKKKTDSAPPAHHDSAAPAHHDSAAPAQHTSAPPAQNTASPAQHTSAPPVQNTAPPAQQHTDRTSPSGAQPGTPNPNQRHDMAPPSQGQSTPASNQPAQHQMQGQPNRSPDNRNPPPATTGGQPGRTFGNQPGAQPGRTPDNQSGAPGRTFGNQPSAQPGRTFGNNPPSAYQPGARPGGPPPRVVTTGHGDVIHRDAGGQVRQVHMSNGTNIYHPPDGPRRVEVVRPGGRVVVTGAPGHGYVQRPVVVNNTTIIKRTYIYNGVPQARIYRPHVYNGVTLAIYTPVRYYRPTFYAYAYNPWARPISYSWGWGGRPWYGYYGGYFTPYPVYASPALWLTDFMIAATLEAAYQERMASRSAPPGVYQDAGQNEPLTPEVKQAISDEVRRQIDLERASGGSANASGAMDNSIFTDNVPHVFVVHAAFGVNSNYGECTIAEGDVLRMTGPPPMNSPSAELVVLASRGRDCRKGSTVSVGLADLQEMHNQMVATIDRGMGDLQTKQGQGGLPTLPQGSAGTIDTQFAQEAQPDANVAAELTSVSQEADRAEQQAVQAGDTVSATPAPTLSLDMSISDVKAIQGEPQKIVDLGAKKIYVYKDLKITFTDGRVTDIQ
jgi:hypothetical protein